jgi:WD40 repeat protein
MAQVQRHRRAIAAALLGLVALAFAPALAQDQGAKDKTDLYDRPVLAIDPGMHTASIQTQAVDAEGRFAVTGGDDRTVRIWSVADGKRLRTIWIPVGPESVGAIYAVAISHDGSTIAAGGWTERRDGPCPIYLFDRESGNLLRRIGGDLPDVTLSLTFSPDGRYLAATLGGKNGLRVFDRNNDWREAFRDDQYGNDSHGAAFALDGRLVTTSFDGLIRLYRYNPNSDSPNFHPIGEPVTAASGRRPFGVAFSPDGKRLAAGYHDVVPIDILDGTTLKLVGTQSVHGVEALATGNSKVAWSADGQVLFATGDVFDARRGFLLFAWDRGGLAIERRMTYCADSTATGVNALPDGRILAAGMRPCLGLMDASGEKIWTVASPILDLRDQAYVMRVSQNGDVVDFGYSGSAGPVLRFNVRSLTMLGPLASDGLTFAPNLEGLTIDGWQDGTNPTLGGRALRFEDDIAHSLAIAVDAKRFFLGSMYALTAFDDTGG